MKEGFELPSAVSTRIHMVKLTVALLAMVAFMFGLVMMHSAISSGVDARSDGVAFTTVDSYSQYPGNVTTASALSAVSEAETAQGLCDWSCEGGSSQCAYTDVECNVVAPPPASVLATRPAGSEHVLERASVMPKSIIGIASHSPEPDLVVLSVSRI